MKGQGKAVFYRLLPPPRSNDATPTQPGGMQHVAVQMAAPAEAASGATRRAGTSPVSADVRETIVERQVQFQSRDCKWTCLPWTFSCAQTSTQRQCHPSCAIQGIRTDRVSESTDVSAVITAAPIAGPVASGHPAEPSES